MHSFILKLLVFLAFIMATIAIPNRCSESAHGIKSDWAVCRTNYRSNDEWDRIKREQGVPGDGPKTAMKYICHAFYGREFNVHQELIPGGHDGTELFGRCKEKYSPYA
eukprot:27811_1